MHIRWMIRRDMPEVLAIEQAEFDYPWTEQSFEDNLRRRNCVGKVVEHNERVIGYMIYDLHKRHYELLNVAVHHEYQWQGVGSAMVHKLINKLTPQRRSRITAVVADDNLNAQLWLRSLNFRVERILHEYFAPPADGYWFVLRLVAPLVRERWSAQNRIGGMTNV